MARIWLFCWLVSSRVPGDASKIHPKISFHWLYLPSPFKSFFFDMASLHCTVISSGYEKMLSTACMIQWRTLQQWRQEPCAIPIKSSTKTFMCSRSPMFHEQGMVLRLWQWPCELWDNFGSHWTGEGLWPDIELEWSPAVMIGCGVLKSVRWHSVAKKGCICDVSSSLRCCTEGWW